MVFAVVVSLKAFVALLAEGVDRNCCTKRGIQDQKSSPSSRRAWIEMFGIHGVSSTSPMSPSSRRAWIEMRVRAQALP